MISMKTCESVSTGGVLYWGCISKTRQLGSFLRHAKCATSLTELRTRDQNVSVPALMKMKALFCLCAEKLILLESRAVLYETREPGHKEAISSFNEDPRRLLVFQ
jgi:hypothetical protein